MNFALLRVALNTLGVAKVWRDASGNIAGIASPTGNPVGQTVSADVIANFSIAASHANQLIPIVSSDPVAVTLQPDATLNLPIGTTLSLLRKGAGAVLLAPGAGVTINTPASLSARAQYSTIGVVKIAANTWLAFGDL